MNPVLAGILAGFILIAIGLTCEASDPAGGWSTCKHIQTGKVIVVEGGSCPYGWMKVY